MKYLTRCQKANTLYPRSDVRVKYNVKAHLDHHIRWSASGSQLRARLYVPITGSVDLRYNPGTLLPYLYPDCVLERTSVEVDIFASASLQPEWKILVKMASLGSRF